MKKYEYKKIHDPYVGDLNAAGLEGWKVVLQQAKGGHIILMRELPEPTMSKPDKTPYDVMIEDCEKYPEGVVRAWLNAGKYDLKPIFSTDKKKEKHWEMEQQVLDRFTPPYDKNLSSFCSTQGEVIEVPPPTEKDDPGCILERFSIVEAAQAIFLSDKKTSDPILPGTLHPSLREEEKDYLVYGGGECVRALAGTSLEDAIDHFRSLYPDYMIKKVETVESVFNKKK